MKKPQAPRAHGKARPQVRKIRITDVKESGEKSTSITIDKTTGELAGIKTSTTTKGAGKSISPQFASSVANDISKAK